MDLFKRQVKLIALTPPPTPASVGHSETTYRKLASIQHNTLIYNNGRTIPRWQEQERHSETTYRKLAFIHPNTLIYNNGRTISHRLEQEEHNETTCRKLVFIQRNTLIYNNGRTIPHRRGLGVEFPKNI